MQIFGTMYPLKMSVGNAAVKNQNIDTIVNSEKLLKITPTQDVYLLLIPKSKSTNADANDYLLKANVETEWLVGRALNRISIFNNSGSSAVVHIAILY